MHSIRASRRGASNNPRTSEFLRTKILLAAVLRNGLQPPYHHSEISRKDLERAITYKVFVAKLLDNNNNNNQTNFL